jgi:Mn-dependent DtxR family transcriptional regulator
VNPVSQQFLELAYEKVVQTNRSSVNGITISQQMGLSHGDYIHMIDRLQEAGYVYSEGGMAKDVVLTNAGIRQAKSN